MPTHDTSRPLLTVRQFSEKHPAFSQPSLRSHIFQSKPRASSRGLVPGNGLESALIRLGKRVLIDEVRFFEWIDAQQTRAA